MFFTVLYCLIGVLALAELGWLFVHTVATERHVGLFFLALLATPFMMIGLGNAFGQISLRSQSFGSVQRVDVDQSVSTLETENGFFTVRGAVNATKGAAVTRSERPLGLTYLCVDGACYQQK